MADGMRVLIAEGDQPRNQKLAFPSIKGSLSCHSLEPFGLHNCAMVHWLGNCFLAQNSVNGIKGDLKHLFEKELSSVWLTHYKLLLRIL